MTYSDAVTAISDAQRRVPATVRALKRVSGLTDEAIGRQLGISRQKVQARMSGATKWSTPELAGLGAIFGVDVGVLYLEPAEALRCLVETNPGLLTGTSP